MDTEEKEVKVVEDLKGWKKCAKHGTRYKPTVAGNTPSDEIVIDCMRCHLEAMPIKREKDPLISALLHVQEE